MLTRVKGVFNVPKNEWPRVEYNAKQRIYRYITKHVALEVSRCGQHVLLENKKLLRKSEVDKTVSRVFHQNKGISMRNCPRKVALSSIGCGMKDVKRIIGRKRGIQVSIYFNLVTFLLLTFGPFTHLRH